MKAERKKTHQSKQRERLWHASLHAEDEAVAYLHKFDPAVISRLHAVWSKYWRSNGRPNKRK